MKSVFRQFFYHLLFIALFFDVNAQESRFKLSGTVVDQHTLQPLVGVTVLLKNDKQYGVASNDDGQFEIKGLKEGEYQCVVKAIGYKEVSKMISINRSLEITFYIEESIEELETVDIQESIISQEIPYKGYELGTIETENFQTQSIELNNLLNQVPGVQVRRQGGFGSRSNYYINGLGYNAIRFFMDGIPMDYFGSSYSINTIPISLIERIDVYKGVVPVELGSDALGGAVHIISKQEVNNLFELSYSYGSFNTHQATINAQHINQKNGLTFKISSFYNHSDNTYEVWGNDIYVTDPETFEIKRGIRVPRFNDSFSSKAIKADIGFTFVKFADRFYVSILASDLDKEIQHGATMEVPFGEASYHQKQLMPHLTYQKKDFVIDGFDVNLFSSYSILNLSRVDTSQYIYNWYGEVEGNRTLGGEQKRTLNEQKNAVFLNRTNLSYRINNTFKLGFNHVYTSLKREDNDPLINIKSKTTGYYAPQYFDKHSLGLSIQGDILKDKGHFSLFTKHFILNYDVKYSEYIEGVETFKNQSSSTSDWSTGFAFVYQFPKHFSINTSLSNAVRLPEPNEVLGDGLLIENNPHLLPEKSLNINVGLEKKFLHEQKQTITLNTNAFYRKVEDQIQQIISPRNEGLFVYQNIDKVDISGVDAQLSFHWEKKFVFNQTVSYLSPIVETDKDELGNENILKGTTLPNTPLFQSNTEFQLHFHQLPWADNNKIFLYWNINHVAEFYRYSEEIGSHQQDIIPTQWVNNCGMSYTFLKKKLVLSFDMSNVFDRQVFDEFAIQKPGRAYYFKLNYKIY